MKLYATTTSERASKSQGGQDYIDLQVRNEDKETVLCLSIAMDKGMPRIKSIGGVDYLLQEIKDLLAGNEIEKGEKQKGEVFVKDPTCVFCDEGDRNHEH